MASEESHMDGPGGGTSSAKEKLASFRKFASTSYTRARQVNSDAILSIMFSCALLCKQPPVLFSMPRSDWVGLK